MKYRFIISTFYHKVLSRLSMAVNNRFRLFVANGYAHYGTTVFSTGVNNWKSVVYTPPH